MTRNKSSTSVIAAASADMAIGLSGLSLDENSLHNDESSDRSVASESESEVHCLTPSATEREEPLPSVPLQSAGALDNSLSINLALMPGEKDFILSLKPPASPLGSKNPRSFRNSPKHVPCDIVLVLDVSGSMNCAALPPTAAGGTGEVSENIGLSVLDLTKHAAKMVASSLGPKDRLGLITFSSETKVILQLTSMTNEAREAALRKIDAMKPEAATAMLPAIKRSLAMWDDDLKSQMNENGNVRAIYFLTDGQPTDIGSVGFEFSWDTELDRVFPSTDPHSLPSFHTFGFGYNVRSGLLQKMAELGKGTFGFIPDTSQHGTIFANAMANLYSTYATDVELTVEVSSENAGFAAPSPVPGAWDEVCDDAAAWSNEVSSFPTTVSKGQKRYFQLSNIRYGQSKDIVFRCENARAASINIKVDVHYRRQGEIGPSKASAKGHVGEFKSLSPSAQRYHLLRMHTCKLLRDQCQPDTDARHVSGEIVRLVDAEKRRAELVEWNSKLILDDDCKAILQDLTDQVEKALHDTAAEPYYCKWGTHYLRSLLSAHAHQARKCFKDPGPNRYGLKSVLFREAEQALQEEFKRIPPPKPSLIHQVSSHARSQPIRMSRYMDQDAGCWTSDTKILLPNGQHVFTSSLRPRMEVSTPIGARKIAEVQATYVHGMSMLQDRHPLLTITDWHPMKWGKDQTHRLPYVFPKSCEVDGQFKRTEYTGFIYSLLLEPSDDPQAHNVWIGGWYVSTMGHGVTKAEGESDARAHEFFGDYEKVRKALEKLPVDARGVRQSSGSMRSSETGKVEGFHPAFQNGRSVEWGRHLLELPVRIAV